MIRGVAGDMLKQSGQTPKQVMHGSPHADDDFPKLLFCILQRNQAQQLPPSEQEGPPGSSEWSLAQQHEFLPLVVFNNEAL
jgi:hypothetical protein